MARRPEDVEPEETQEDDREMAVWDMILDEMDDQADGFPQDPVHAAGIVGEMAGSLMRECMEFTYGKSTDEKMLQAAVATAAAASKFVLALQRMVSRPSSQV